MTDVNDWSEPGDDREPDPPEEHEPLDLDELAATLTDALGDPGELGQATAEVLDAVPHLLARLRAAEAKVARWEGLDHRTEYAVQPPDGGRVVFHSASAAQKAAPKLGGEAQARTVFYHPWVGIQDPPF